MGDAALAFRNLSKVYRLRGHKAVHAVNNLDFEVGEGQIFGFLGPNGAGKTTTIKMLVGFVSPTSGTAEILGLPIEMVEARERVGYLAEEAYFHPFLTPREALWTHARILGLPRDEARDQIEELLDMVGVSHRSATPIGKLSKGTAQRVGLAVALLGDPDLLILDEPGSGLDPIGRRELRALLVGLKAAGKTIFLSSHLLSEVEAICDTVGMLSEGRLVALGPPAAIKQTGTRLRIVVAGLHASLGGLPQTATVDVDTASRTTRIEVDRNEAYPTMRALEAAGATLDGVEECSETLEDAFVRLAA